MLEASKPVVAVTAVRTGCGKSPTSRRIGAILLMAAGLRVGLVRHPMPYGDLEAMRVQRFTSLEEIDAAHPTLEEREEYEIPVSMGMTVYAGRRLRRRPRARAARVRRAHLGRRQQRPALRAPGPARRRRRIRCAPGDELTYHPGETNLLRADVVVVNKIDSAEPRVVARVLEHVESVNPLATVDHRPLARDARARAIAHGVRVLVVEDGPTLTHGGMAFGAGTVAALRDGAAELVDPRPFARGSIADVLAEYPHIGKVLPAMGYSDARCSASSRRRSKPADADVVVAGTPIDLARRRDHAPSDQARALRARGGRAADAGRRRSHRCCASCAGPTALTEQRVVSVAAPPIPQHLLRISDLEAESIVGAPRPGRGHEDAPARLRRGAPRRHARLLLREAVHAHPGLVRGCRRAARDASAPAPTRRAPARPRRDDRGHGPDALRLRGRNRGADVLAGDGRASRGGVHGSRDQRADRRPPSVPGAGRPADDPGALRTARGRCTWPSSERATTSRRRSSRRERSRGCTSIVACPPGHEPAVEGAHVVHDPRRGGRRRRRRLHGRLGVDGRGGRAGRAAPRVRAVPRRRTTAWLPRVPTRSSCTASPRTAAKR